MILWWYSDDGINIDFDDDIDDYSIDPTILLVFITLLNDMGKLMY